MSAPDAGPELVRRTDLTPFWRVAFTYQRWVDQLAEITGWISKWVVFPTIAVGFINVLLRYLGRFTEQRLTNNGLVETQWYLYALIFLFGFQYILKHGINVRVDFWYANLSKRARAMIDFVGNWIGLIPFCILGLWLSIPQVAQSWRLNEQSPDPSGLPRAPIKTMIPVAFALLLLQAIAEQVKLYAILRDMEEFVEVEEREAPLRIE